MQITRIKRKGNWTTTSQYNLDGPVGNAIGFFLSLGSVIVTGIIFIFVSIFMISDVNNLRYKPVTATVTNITQNSLGDDFTVAYNVDGNEYSTNIYLNNAVKVGETTQIYYNPSNPEKIAESNKMEMGLVFMFIVIFIIFFSSIIGLKRNFNNFMSYIRPDKYKYDNSEPMSVQGSYTGDLDYDDIKKLEDGEYNQIRF